MKQLFIFIALLLIMATNTTLSQPISLDGEWLFAADSSGLKQPAETSSLFWRKINVPSSWQAVFDDLREYQGIGWYKKTVNLAKADPEKIYLIRFNAVDFLSEVWVNGTNLGKHEGGYTPFTFDITNVIKEGNNEIVVRVLDPVYDPPGTEGILYQHIPHGKQSWYVQTSGLWQSVSIEVKPQIYFTSFHITPSNNGDIIISYNLNKWSDEPQSAKVIITSPGNEELLNQEIRLTADNFKLNVDNPKLWSPDTPNLYTLKISINEEEKTERFGFRKFEAKDGYLYLNDEPYYMIAALDQDFYPETIYTTPSEEYMRDQMIKAKKLGLNMLRCHIKVPDPLYLKVADEVGLLVWYEVPNWAFFSDTSAHYGEATMDAMLERDWNHPSLVIVSIINESWGLDMSQQNQRDWLAGEYDRVKQKAAGRLVVDNSACWGNFHVKTDINDYHTYWAIPENRANFDNTVKEFASRPDWLFSKHGDSQERGDEPLILSEFGNWGLPKLSGDDPWWFKNDFLDNALVLPAGYNDRFLEYKYDDIFSSYNDLAETSQRAQFQALKYEIEQIRLHPEIQGYVITEFTDLNWECNGLLDMWRNFKIYADELNDIQQGDIIIPRPVKYNFSVGDIAEIKLYLSHYSNTPLDKAFIQWTSNNGGSGKIPVPSLNRTEVKELETVKLNLTKPGVIRIEFELMVDNKTLSKNYSEIYSYSPVQKGAAAIKTDHNQNLWNEFTQQLGSSFEHSPKEVLITNYLNEDYLAKVSEGASLICLVDTNTAFTPDFPIKLISREGDWYDGNWASNLNWKRDHPIFKDINNSKHFGFEIAQTVPRIVLGNIPAGNFSDVIAGMYVGWIQFNSAYIYRMDHGEGEIIFCTFPVAENYSTDPFARNLFNNIVDFISKEEVPGVK